MRAGRGRYVPGRVMELPRLLCLISGAVHGQRTLARVRCRHPLKSGKVAMAQRVTVSLEDDLTGDTYLRLSLDYWLTTNA